MGKAADGGGPGLGRWARLDRPPLDAAALAAALVTPAGPFARLDVVAASGSTNADLVAAARTQEDLPDLTVLTTDHQHAGRGRLGRSWQTPARAALATSLLLRPPVPVARWSWLSLLAGLAVSEALRSVAGVDARLKWPNDVVVVSGPGPGKVAGVLTEVVLTPRGPAAVVGAGVNVTQSRAELPVETATSLLLAGAATLDRDTLLRVTLRQTAQSYRDWVATGGDAVACGLAHRVREACTTLGQQVRVELPGGVAPLTGVAQEVDDDGRLVVDVDGGPVAVAAGDVVHVRPRNGQHGDP